MFFFFAKKRVNPELVEACLLEEISLTACELSFRRFRSHKESASRRIKSLFPYVTENKESTHQGMIKTGGFSTENHTFPGLRWRQQETHCPVTAEDHRARKKYLVGQSDGWKWDGFAASNERRNGLGPKPCLCEASQKGEPSHGVLGSFFVSRKFTWNWSIILCCIKRWCLTNSGLHRSASEQFGRRTAPDLPRSGPFAAACVPEMQLEFFPQGENGRVWV